GVRILHAWHQWLDGASGRIRDWNRGRVASHERAGALVEPLAPLAIPAQHDRVCRDGQLRDGRPGGLLSLDETARSLRSAVCPGRRRGWGSGHDPDAVSHGGRSRTDGDPTPAGDAGRHGRPLPKRRRWPWWANGTWSACDWTTRFCSRTP